MNKQIQGFEDYEIAPDGTIYSIPRRVRSGRTFGTRMIRARKLKPFFRKGNPYVQLYKDGKKVCLSVRTLIKKHFEETSIELT